MSVGGVFMETLALLVFIAGAITDFLDGSIARSRNLITNFGKLMDPLADKVLMLAAFIMMMDLAPLWIPGWAVVLVLAREFLVTGLRTLAASQGAVLAAMNSGKTKTVLQITFVIAFSIIALALDAIRAGYLPEALLPVPLDDAITYTRWASLGCFVAITLHTVHSGIEFTRANWQQLHLDDR
jgi:CDP-diacylglycerol--glycerol-3-phosphate 3-phosphatidyltransferase